MTFGWQLYYRNRPTTVIPGFQMYFRFAATTDVRQTPGYEHATGHCTSQFGQKRSFRANENGPEGPSHLVRL